MKDRGGNIVARRTVLGIFAGGLMAALSGCGAPESRYHQRITVEVETPSGLKKGSSVIEVSFTAKPKALEHIPGNGFSVHGEAVAVDVATGKVLFALLSPPPDRGGDTSWYQAMLFGDALRVGAMSEPPLTLPGDGSGIDAHKVIGNSRAKVTLPPQLYPLLVTFRDISDPKSVQRVDPANLAAVFGSGTKLKRIVLEVTDEPVSTGIEKRLAWLSGYRNKTFAGNRYAVDNSLADSLGTGSFSTEPLK